MNDPEFFVRAKSLNRTYKRQSFTITFIPGDRLWKWEVTYVQTTSYSDTAKTMALAKRAAEKHIDKTLSLRGES